MTAARRIGLVSAVGIGVGSMLGAGVFAVWAPAAEAAGRWLVVAVALAAVVAVLNALSTAQLAAYHPVAGGVYTYGSRELGPGWGFVAGAGFVIGKTASVAAMALAIGAYVWPDRAPAVAAAAIVAAWILNATGVRRTTGVATVIAAAVVVGLAVVAFASLTQPAGTGGDVDLGGIEGAGLEGDMITVATGVGGAAALIFFAFAGYARLATLGEEVRDPARTIPRAIAIAVAAVVTIYLALALVVIRRPGAADLTDAERPLVLAAPDGPGWAVALGVLAALAATGAMVALMAGIGRTAMAMAREGDLPRALARTTPSAVPTLAEGAAAAIAIALAWWGDLTFALSMSSAAVLVYYAVAHGAAMRAARVRHTAGFVMPRWAAQAGLVLCVALVLSLEVVPTLTAIAAALILLGVRKAVRARAARRREESGEPHGR